MADDKDGALVTDRNQQKEEAANTVSEETNKQSRSANAKEEKEQKSSSANPKLTKIIDQIKELSVLELSELVHALEDVFGVNAQAPIAVAAAPAAGNGEAEGPKEEQTTFNVILAAAGANKISVIKALREVNNMLGLKEAKDLVDAAPKEILNGVNKATANEAKQKLTAAGASVELK